MAALTRRDIPGSLAPAYEECVRLARSHYENFTIVSRFARREIVPHLSAIYAYCRGVDDLGDEAPGDRLALLDAWKADLDLCYGGTPESPRLRALQHTIDVFDIPPDPFRALIEANRLDQLHDRHSTFSDLLHYCRHSANPVGHLYLYVAGYRDAERQRLSDFTCTALQLANFWQDVRRDLAMGRIYLPQEDMARFGYPEEALAADICNDAFRALIAFQVKRTHQLFLEGLPLIDMLDGSARLHVALFSLGGRRVLDAIRGQRYDVLSKRPTVTRTRKTWLLLKTYLGMKLTRRL